MKTKLFSYTKHPGPTPYIAPFVIQAVVAVCAPENALAQSPAMEIEEGNVRAFLAADSATWDAGWEEISLGAGERGGVQLAVNAGSTRTTWASAVGARYQFQLSDDLEEWRNQGAPLPGTGEQLEVVSAVPEKAVFLRVVDLSISDVLTGRDSLLRIPLLAEVGLGDVAKLTLNVPFENPATGALAHRSVSVTHARLESGSWALLVDGPVTAGSVLTLGEGVLFGLSTDVVGTVPLAGDLLDSTVAARWFKPFRPTNRDYFPSGVYPGGAPAEGIPQSTDPEVVGAELEAHLGGFQMKGWLAPDEVHDLLQRYQDAALREAFVDPESGTFEPQLLAAVLATAGTVGAGAIPAILDGENASGRPAVVVYGELRPGLLGGTDVLEVGNQLQWRITLHPVLRNEPFPVVSALMAHEALHDDTQAIGQHEEVVGKSMEVNVWKQQILVAPQLAVLRTPLARFLNLETLLYANSGGVFPHAGIFQARGVTDILPESSVDSESFDTFMRSEIYDETPDTVTEGNALLDSYLSAITGTRRQGLRFDASTLAMLDRSQHLSDDQEMEVLRVLALEPVP